MANPVLDLAGLQVGLTTARFGRAAEFYPSLGSTNDLASALARAGAAEGLLVLADEQTAGRGRLGRSWTAPAGSSILASLLLRPRLPRDQAFAPTMIMGLAVQQAAVQFGVPATLKWPNDVLVADKKLAGILCEVAYPAMHAPGAGVPECWVVAGFGVNVNFDLDGYELGERATSFSRELRGPLDRLALLNEILLQAEHRYYSWQRGAYAPLWREWRSNLSTIGRRVRIDIGSECSVEGQALAVEHDGALVVATSTGRQRVVSGTTELLPGS